MGCVIFDLDGTLADTSADLMAAANACFDEIGLGPLLERGRDEGVALRGGRRMLTVGLTRADAFSESEVDRLYPRLLEHYANALCVDTHLFPDVVEVCGRLKAEGYRLGVCTNKPQGLAAPLLQALGVADLFESLVGADTLPVRKPHPAPFQQAVLWAGGQPERACLVGDSDTDHNTARAAGVPSILVAFGPSGEDMAALNPDALLASYADLPRVLRDLDLFPDR